MNRYDSLIFDMDGTLWDAVDSYARVWDISFARMGIDATVSREQLVGCMGMKLSDILDTIVDPAVDIDRARFLDILAEEEARQMPRLGGRLYPGVADGIAALARRYRLFMVSNCAACGISNFLAYTGLTPYIDDHISNGENGLDKTENIRLIATRNGLTNPVYIGDTAGDAAHSHAAGVDFIHAAWGFGTVDPSAASAASFNDLVKMLTT